MLGCAALHRPASSATAIDSSTTARLELLAGALLARGAALRWTDLSSTAEAALRAPLAASVQSDRCDALPRLREKRRHGADGDRAPIPKDLCLPPPSRSFLRFFHFISSFLRFVFAYVGAALSSSSTALDAKEDTARERRATQESSAEACPPGSSMESSPFRERVRGQCSPHDFDSATLGCCCARARLWWRSTGAS